MTAACKGCGACCRYLARALAGKLSEDDRRFMAYHGAFLDTREEMAFFPISCSQLDKKTGICSIYDQRPGACKDFLMNSEQCRMCLRLDRGI